MGKHLVCVRRCDECLYNPKTRIVPAKRANQIIKHTLQTDSDFLCHKSKLNKDGQMTRISGRLGVIQFVDPDTGEPVDEEKEAD